MILESLVPLANLLFTSFSSHLVLHLHVDYKSLSLSCLYWMKGTVWMELSWATRTQFRKTRASFVKFASYKKCQQTLFFGLGRFHPTTVLSSLLFFVFALFYHTIFDLFLATHGTYSPPITIIHPRSYLRASICPWTPNSHQIRFFFISYYAPNCPRSLNGSTSRVHIVNRWALTSPYCSKPLIYVAKQMTTFRSLWIRL